MNEGKGLSRQSVTRLSWLSLHSWKRLRLHKQLIRRLDLVTLQLFVAVHEEGTLTRAASREAIAVSAASKRLVELKVVLGIALFSRTARGMTLTAAGETLLHHARRILIEVEKVGIEVGEHLQGLRGYVRMLANFANLSAIIHFYRRIYKALTPEQQKIQELESRIARLEREKSILKQANALLMSEDLERSR